MSEESFSYGDIVEMRSHEDGDWMGPFFYLGEIKEHFEIWRVSMKDDTEVKVPRTHFGIGADFDGRPVEALRCHRFVREVSEATREKMQEQEELVRRLTGLYEKDES